MACLVPMTRRYTASYSNLAIAGGVARVRRTGAAAGEAVRVEDVAYFAGSRHVPGQLSPSMSSQGRQIGSARAPLDATGSVLDRFRVRLRFSDRDL